MDQISGVNPPQMLQSGNQPLRVELSPPQPTVQRQEEPQIHWKLIVDQLRQREVEHAKHPQHPTITTTTTATIGYNDKNDKDNSFWQVAVAAPSRLILFHPSLLSWK